MIRVIRIVVISIIALAVFIGLFVGGFWLERWVNWKVSYGPKVEHRLERVEARLDSLESRR
jgi:uncharacterized membrane-anchored protein YhcB (DUF1043 family)